MATCRFGRKGSSVLPLYQDPWFTFRFAEDRIIPRFHLEGVEAGRRVAWDDHLREEAHGIHLARLRLPRSYRPFVSG